ncbi:DUF4136 domain-containing protein [Cupriavidus plantarum]|uniref:DUF4136 domain-containing protein n=1 Tax=Cupriavidus plantarum TaxID=942865 RepID=UPI0015CBA7E0|nr:DUF4136 domain-containing protein [Cupriavidus plantarum]NYH98299.1 hypothetical protein [Cupriavidus plantarum]CAG2127736.1 hypothetical protein LMG26296_00779 [Cupriavidus plantarum]SMR67086.1 protein of unknown function [Cupriavidus plantarum]
MWQYISNRLGLALLAALWLSGCASTITTEVTAFRQPEWQNDAPRTYAFENTAQQAAQQEVQLERTTYEQWLAAALSGVGFEQLPAGKARYLVSMDYDAVPGMVRVAETVYADPWYGPWGPYWGPYGGYGGWYRPYGPWGWGPGYWPPQTVVRDVPVTFASLRVFFKDAKSGKRVYQVTARNTTEGGSLAGVMPYMIRSAFADFPGESGRPRRVTLEVEKAKQ